VTPHERENLNVRPYHVKPGIKTTEFWLAVVVIAVATAIAGAQALEHRADAASWVAALSAAITSIGYSRSRSLAKSGR
jgi:hypothetical protein